MCGIFGTIVKSKNGLWTPEEAFIQNLLVVGAVRGDHGTGTFWVPHTDPTEVDYLKIAGNPYNLIHAKEWGDYWKEAKSKAKAFVGHHRYATKGKHTTDNAHPFQHKHITMVHNGTIHWGLTKYEKMPGVEVDSHALTIAIAEEGLQVLADMSGAFACVWHNAEDGTLNIAKNNERPLSLVRMENGNYFFASEGPMLAWALNRVAHDKKWEKVDLVNNKHYKFNLENLGEPEVSPLPEKKWTSASSGSYSTYGSYQGGTTKTQERTEKGTSFEKTEHANFEVVRFFRVFAHGQLRFTYLCKTDYDEACWFTSIREFKVGERLSGKIGLPVINRWTEDWTTVNTPWYPIEPNSVGVSHANRLFKMGPQYLTVHELGGMKKRGCIDCGAKLSISEMQKKADDLEFFKVNSTEYGFLCEPCTKHFNLGQNN